MSNIDYKSIELPVSIRHYFFLNNASKLFANVSYIFDFANDSFIEFTDNDGSQLDTYYFSTVKISPRRNFGLGFGYKFKDRYSLEMKYHTNRNILNNYSYWNPNYKTISLIFGYTLF